MEITIKFSKSEKIVKAYLGRPLLYIARDNGIKIPSPCGGCRVKVIEGNDIFDISEEEYNKMTDEQIESNWRLSCSFIPHSDINIDY